MSRYRGFLSQIVGQSSALHSSSRGPERRRVPPTSSQSQNQQLGIRHISKQHIAARVLNAQYAVRGPQAILADKLQGELAASRHKGGPKAEEELVRRRGWKDVVPTNIGNPQALGQKPITFFRQVLALTTFPELVQAPGASALFPPDVISRATHLVHAFNGSTGAYTHSQGAPHVRRSVAKFIAERDGTELGAVDPTQIFLTAGASPALQLVLQILISAPDVGIMVPVPQYPLYSASVTLFDGRLVSYPLTESQSGWSLTPESIRESIIKARAAGTIVRALVIINPGNPTGNCLSWNDIESVIKIANEENLVLLADEVYQSNAYLPERPFHSFRKVLLTMAQKDPRYKSQELFSFHSVSKGVVGECGMRGGYVECLNIDPDVIAEMYKLCSVGLCSNTSGQVLVDLMVDPPKPGEPSYELYQRETTETYESLKRRAVKLVKFFNSLEGVTCAPPEGALYVHPRIRLSEKAVAEAKKHGQEPDEFYAMEMLKATGVCVVPGTGFLQEEGTSHFRSTFLPPEDTFDSFMGRIEKFHKQFMAQYK